MGGGEGVGGKGEEGGGGSGGGGEGVAEGGGQGGGGEGGGDAAPGPDHTREWTVENGVAASDGRKATGFEGKARARQWPR